MTELAYETDADHGILLRKCTEEVCIDRKSPQHTSRMALNGPGSSITNCNARVAHHSGCETGARWPRLIAKRGNGHTVQCDIIKIEPGLAYAKW